MCPASSSPWLDPRDDALALPAAKLVNRLHILVVEDEAILRDDITSYLRDCGCVVHEADSAEQAVAMGRAGLRVDVLFTDINLNGTAEGWGVAQAFRIARPAVGVVYTSGSCVDQSPRVAGSLFFRKPYVRSEILATCRHVQKMPAVHAMID
jgi:CheY-like chemotaxis protein